MPRMFSRKTSRATWSTVARVSAVVVPVALFLPAWVAAQGTPAETHTVRPGDTLWDLAKKYRGDPFLWPDIYRLNTAVVEDPHWIYPGEVLRLTPADNVKAVPSADTPVPPDQVASNNPSKASGDTTASGRGIAGGDSVSAGMPDVAMDDPNYVSLFPTSKPQLVQETLRAYTNQPYRPLRRSEFYASGFLTEGEKLPFGQLLGPLLPSQIRSYSNRDLATLHSSVGIEAPAGGSYQVGDSLLLANLGADVEHYGRVVIPMGLVQVTEATDGRYLAKVVAVYGPIRKGQYVLPAARFTPADTVRAKPVANGIRGRLLAGRGRQELKAPQMVVFLDKGRQDGVAPGDIFEARRQPQRLADGAMRIDDVMAVFQIVRVGERSATARVLNVLSPDIPPGTEVRQVAKLP
jgi:LysM repeat protein